MLCGLSMPAFADDAAPAAAAAAAAAAAPAAAADAAARRAAAAAPIPNKGDTAWMLVATLLVIMMSIPGLALFYGGLVRSKNMLSVLMQVFAIFALIIVLWAIYGYSLAFTAGQCLHRRIRPAVPEGHLRPGHRQRRQCRDLQQGRGDSRVRIRRLPGHFRRHHRGADRGRFRRAHEVLCRAAVLRAVVHLRLPADRAHGVVLARPGCLHRCRCGRCCGRCVRLAVPEGRAGLRGRHRGAHQRRRSPVWWAHIWSASASATARNR